MPTNDTQSFWNDIYLKYRQQTGNLLPHIHPILQKRFPQALWSGNPGRREVALTFDDGPHPQDTPDLLEVLDRHQVKATFFLVGERVEMYPDLVAQVAARGHQFGIHGYRHEPFPLISSVDLQAQLDTTRNLISAASGYAVEHIRDVRPPYGVALNSTVQRLLQWQYRPVMWSIVPLHWFLPEQETIQHVLRLVCCGSLIVLHENQPGHPVAELTDRIVAQVKAMEYTFITVDQMWQQINL